jgi:hypothetical protein
MAQKAKGQEMTTTFVLQARKAGRLQKSNMTLQQLHDKMELLYRALRKMYEVAAVILADMEDEIEVKEREYKMIRAGYSAFKKAMSILRGQSDKKDLYDQTMDYLAEDFGQKVGEIEHFVEVSRSFIETVDIENGIYEDDALKMFEEWEKKGDSILLGPDEKKLLIECSNDQGNVLNLDEPLPQKELVVAKARQNKDTQKYNDLLCL